MYTQVQTRGLRRLPKLALGHLCALRILDYLETKMASNIIQVAQGAALSYSIVAWPANRRLHNPELLQNLHALLQTGPLPPHYIPSCTCNALYTGDCGGSQKRAA